jgi:cysteinyl-tRNA synthetase
MIVVHNTLSGKKEPFAPLEKGRVTMYVCGLTVYDAPHIGHGRTFIGFDVVARWLRASGYEVTYARNVTDIEDRIINRARENGENINALTARVTQGMHDDFGLLGIDEPDIEPRATQYVPQMIALIERLIARGLAYQSQSRDVNFSVRELPGYGKLSKRSLDDMRAGERVAVDETKRDPLDFVLWKAAKDEEPPEAKWPSPWGPGRPGWHIECSAMVMSLLGETIDIHGGGPDLIFPHHENEIAQSEGATGKPFARYWMHTGQLNIRGDKMGKSLGNFINIREASETYGAEALRFFLVRTHYRSPIDFSDDLVAEAEAGLARLYEALRRVPPDGKPLDKEEAFAKRFAAAMDDDFNSAQAVAVLFELASEVNRGGSAALSRQLKGLGNILGILDKDPLTRGKTTAGIDAARIEALIAERNAARARKDFTTSDRVRDELAAAGVVLQDEAGGKTSWRVK